MIAAENKPLFGDIVRSLREGRGLAQNELAKRCGIASSNLNRIENHRQGAARTRTVLKLCTGLGYQVSDEPCQELLRAAGITLDTTPVIPQSATFTSDETLVFEARLSSLEFKLQRGLNVTKLAQQTFAEAIQEVQRLRAEHQNLQK